MLRITRKRELGPAATPAVSERPKQAVQGESSLGSAAAPEIDRSAVERVLAGDTAAFAMLVERWQGSLINLAWRYSRDRGRAEEMAQEAFVRAWRGLGQWRTEGSFSTWLFSVAANCYRSELKRMPALPLSLEQVAEPSLAFTRDRELDGEARDETVRRAVFALPLKYREPLILYYFCEMNLSLAASTLKMAEGTMKARLCRGRALLRQRFPELREHLETPEPGSSTAKPAGSPPLRSETAQKEMR